jgi:hypothetical protein
VAQLVAHLLWEQRVAGSNPVTPTSYLVKEVWYMDSDKTRIAQLEADNAALRAALETLYNRLAESWEHVDYDCPDHDEDEEGEATCECAIMDQVNAALKGDTGRAFLVERARDRKLRSFVADAWKRAHKKDPSDNTVLQVIEIAIGYWEGTCARRSNRDRNNTNPLLTVDYAEAWDNGWELADAYWGKKAPD